MHSMNDALVRQRSLLPVTPRVTGLVHASHSVRGDASSPLSRWLAHDRRQSNQCGAIVTASTAANRWVCWILHLA